MAIYYVKSSGNDGLDGLSNSTAWATISKVNGFSFASGDIINFNRGDTWRETLTIPRDHLAFQAYGTGSNPRIVGSNTTTWSLSSGNIWVSDSTFTDPRIDAAIDIFFENAGIVTFGSYKANTGLCVAEFDWTYSGGKIYVYSPTDPDTRYMIIEIPQRESCIDPNNKSNISVGNINLHYATYGFGNSNTPETALTDLTISGCTVSYIGGNITNITNEVGYGIKPVYSNLWISNCEIYQCGRRAIDLHLYGLGFTLTNLLIEDNYIHDCYHTTGVDMSVGSSGYYTASIDGVTIRRNRFEDPIARASNVSELTFIQNTYYNGGARLKNIHIYDNIYKYTSNGAIHMEHGEYVYIYNNVFYGHNTTKTTNCYQIHIDKSTEASLPSTNITIRNNIFYTTTTNDSGGLCVYCVTGVDPAQIALDYNIYYRVNNTVRVIQVGTTTYNMTQLATIRSTYNWETHGKFADPTLTSSVDYHLLAGSPAISAGYNVGLSTDYSGASWGNPPSMGIYEYVDASLTVISRAKIHDWLSSAYLSDWFLPSYNELLSMATVIGSTDNIGGFLDSSYWSSSESGVDPTIAQTVHFVTVSASADTKNVTYPVRAARKFLSSRVYSLGYLRPTGGYIFYIIDNLDGTYWYYEAAPSDQSLSQAWSNIVDSYAGASNIDIGDGTANTAAIIAQGGHTSSAAKLCDDLIV
jgi:hypothetical protein